MSLPMTIRLRGLRRFGVTFVLGLAVTGLSACEKKSSSTTGAAASATGATTTAGAGVQDLCKLLPNAEVGALIGTTIASSRRSADAKPGESECDYLNKDEGIAVAVSMRPIAKNDFVSESKGYEVVPGVGEAAYENHGILTVLHKTSEVTVIHGGSGSVETQKKVASALIKKVDAAAQGK